MRFPNYCSISDSMKIVPSGKYKSQPAWARLIKELEEGEYKNAKQNEYQ